MADDGIHLTYYGYEKPGDPDYDSNSAAGIGDHDNQLEVGLSAALSKSERYARFGLWSDRSTGQEFEYNGMLLRDDDTSPQLFRNVDVYSPSGPGKDSGVRADDDSHFTFRSGYDDLGLEEPEPLTDEEEETQEEIDNPPPKQEETPIDKFRSKAPEYNQLNTPQVIDKLSQLYPNINKDKLAVFAQTPGGMALIKEELARDKTPLERFKDFFPKLANQLGSDDKIIGYMHDHFDPKANLTLFKEKANPHSPLFNAFNHLFSPLGQPGRQESVGEILGVAKHDVKSTDFDPLRDLKDIGDYIFKGPPSQMYGSKKAGYNLEQGADVSLQSFYANLDRWAAGTLQWGANLSKVAGIYGWEKMANDWMAKNIPFYGAADDHFKKFVGSLTAHAMEYDKGAAKSQANLDPTAPISATVGQVAGASPNAAVSFGLGSTGKAAALWGMWWDSQSAYGRAVDHQQTTALAQAGYAADFRYISQTLMNTGWGRIAVGLGTMVASASEDHIQRWLNGDKNNSIDKSWSSGVTGLVMGLFIGGGHATPLRRITSPIEFGLEDKFALEDRPKQLALPYGGARSQPYGSEAIILGQPLRDELTSPVDPNLRGEDWIKSLEEKEKEREKHQTLFEQPEVKFNYSEPVNEELTKAKTKMDNGDHPSAAAHIDRARALMTNGERQEQVNKIIEKGKEIAAPSLPAKPVPKAISATELSGTMGQMGKGLTESLQNMLWEKVQKGETTEAGAPSKLLIAAAREKAAGRLNTRADFDALYADYGRHLSSTQPKGAKFYSGLAPVDPEEVGKTVESLKDDLDGYYLYSGLPLFQTQMYKDFMEMAGESAKFFRAKVLETVAPEYLSEKSRVAGGIVKHGQAAAEQAQNVIPTRFARVNGITTDLEDGFIPEVQEKYFNKFPDVKLQQQMMDYQEGRPINDPTANAIWEKAYRPTYDWLHALMKQYGIDVGYQNNYFQELFRIPKDYLSDEGNVPSGPGKISPIKERKMSYREHLDAGHKPLTNNPRRMLDLYAHTVLQAIQKIRDLRQLEAQGLAWREDNPKIPPGIANGDAKWPKWTTDNGETYFVHREVNPVLRNKFLNKVNLYSSVIAPWMHFARFLKGGTAAILSWSGFHPLHILGITQADAAALEYQRGIHGLKHVDNPGARLLNFVPLAGGIRLTRQAFVKYGDTVAMLQHKFDSRLATPEMLRDAKHFAEMGLSAGINHERQMQFENFMRNYLPDWLRNPKDGTLISMGAKAVGLINHGVFNQFGFSKWWFGEVTPRLKFASAMMRRDFLADTRPELFDAAHYGDRVKEFQKIGRDIEARYGEMNYNNLLWPQWLKQAGTAHLLSLGWNLGMIRTMGDSVVDLTTNAAHWKEITQKGLSLNERQQRAVTNRMAFQGAYLAQGSLTGAAITYFFTGKMPTAWDLIYPKVGTDDKGRDKRVNMQYFAKDIPALWEYTKEGKEPIQGVLHFVSNKMNPMLNTIIQAAINRNFMGKPIGDLNAKVLYVLKNMAPISVQNMIASHGNSIPDFIQAAQEGKLNYSDMIMDSLGYTPSARWTTRTSTEQAILDAAQASPEDESRHDAREKYRAAFVAHDSDGMAEAKRQLKEMHTTDRSIKLIEKEANLSTAQKVFKHLPNWKKVERLRDMSPEEREQYFPLGSKEMRKLFEEEMQKHPGTGYYMPRTPEHALTLAPGTRFHDPDGNLRMVPQNA